MLNLDNQIDFQVKSGDEFIVDTKISVSFMKKKDQKKIMVDVKKAQDNIDEDTVKAIDDLELVAKKRFDIQVSGEGAKDVADFAKEYGFTLVMGEIDRLVSDSKGKR